VPSPFEILSVDPGASDEEIERAYRERVKETHPDHGGSLEAFQSVREAYERILSGEADGTERQRVDASGADEDDGGGSIHPRVEYLNYEVLDDHGWSADDDALFEKAAAAGLSDVDFGSFHVLPRESVLEAAERNGYAWPFACRGGACANCALVVLEGDVETRVDHVLPDEMVADGFQLACNGIPTSDELRVLYNVKHMPELEELLLPPRPFEQAHSDD
jgi:ferredoxin